MIVITIGDSVLSKPFSLQENLLIDQLCFEKFANLTIFFCYYRKTFLCSRIRTRILSGARNRSASKNNFKIHLRFLTTQDDESIPFNQAGRFSQDVF